MNHLRMERKKQLPVECTDALGIANSDIQTIESLIHTIRGKQVILDRDLARLYNVETKRLNEQVKRNIERFPEDFMFRLTKEEAVCSKSQIATLNDEESKSRNATLNKRGLNIKHLPYAFTESGIAMLSSVLRSDVAIAVNIRIMRAFVAMRHFLASNAQLFQRLETIEYHQLEMKRRQDYTDNRIDEIFEKINKLGIPPQGVFYDGQIYDAYSFVADLVRSAERRIMLIDNYVDDTVLTLLNKRKMNVSASVYTGRISSNLQLDIERHNAQYPPLTVGIYRMAHDRFLIIDGKVYHIGASIKDLGKKLFGFSLMQELTAAELLSKIGIENPNNPHN